MNRDEAPVPTFTLYGEREPLGDVEFVHLERIEARSRPHRWHIRPHRHRGLLQVVFVFKGQVRARLESRELHADGPVALMIPAGVIHGFDFRPESHGYVLSIAETPFFQDADVHATRGRAPLFSVAEGLSLSGAGQEAPRVEALLGQVEQELRWPRPGRNQLLEWLVRSVLLLLSRGRADTQPSSTALAGDAALFARFRVLVERHYLEHWRIARYLEVLGTNERRLNRACRAAGGHSASDTVQNRLLLEARRRLVYLARPVNSIAYELGFKDPAYFNRFFRRRAGLSPGAYRRIEQGKRAEPAQAWPRTV